MECMVEHLIHLLRLKKTKAEYREGPESQYPLPSPHSSLRPHNVPLLLPPLSWPWANTDLLISLLMSVLFEEFYISEIPLFCREGTWLLSLSNFSS
jgi:hypothetical protein